MAYLNVRYTAKSALCLLSIFGVLPASSWANDLLVEELGLPLIVSASRLTQTVLTSPASVTVIDKDMIQASAYTDIADVLRLVPGFQVARADGRTYSVTSHGGGWEFGNRLQVLVDGRSTYLSTLSVVDWDNLGVHIDDIDRIEIVRGPSASAFGSNSFSAAVNIITKPIGVDDRTRLKTKIGNLGERETALRYSAQGKNFNYRIHGWSRQSDGLDDFPDFRDLQNLTFQSRLDLADNSNLKIDINFYNGKTGAPEFDELEPVDRKVNGFSGRLEWQKSIDEHSEVQLQMYYNDRDEDDLSYTKPLHEIAGIPRDVFVAITGATDFVVRTGYSTHKAKRADVEGQYSWYSDQSFKAVVGFGARQDKLKSVSYFPELGEIEDTSARVFANAQWVVEKTWSINTGLIFEENGISENHFSPRASVNWSFLPEQSLRFTASRAYRIPSLLEANLNTDTVLSNGFVLDQRYRTNSDLTSEEVLSIELGYQGRTSSLPLAWELKVYREAYENLISFARDQSVLDPLGTDLQRIGNYGSYDTHGFEGEITYRPQLKSFFRFHFNIGRSDYAALDKINPVRQRFDQERTPEESAGVLYVKSFLDWQMSLSVQHIGAMKWDGFGSQVKSNTRWDAAVSKSWRSRGNYKFTAKMGAQSFNRSYHEFNKLLDIRPLYYLNMSVSFE